MKYLSNTIQINEHFLHIWILCFIKMIFLINILCHREHFPERIVKISAAKIIGQHTQIYNIYHTQKPWTITGRMMNSMLSETEVLEDMWRHRGRISDEKRMHRARLLAHSSSHDFGIRLWNFVKLVVWEALWATQWVVFAFKLILHPWLILPWFSKIKTKPNSPSIPGFPGLREFWKAARSLEIAF